MANYNIPGVTTSLVDRSHTTKKVTSGRSVLIAGFCKYGSDEIIEFSDSDEIAGVLGLQNLKKYGLGVKYLKGALTQTSKVLWKRLIATDASFANSVLTSDFTFNRTATTDINVLRSNNLKIDDKETIIKLFAKHQGLGYNDLSIVFEPAINFEKLYSNDAGDLDYRFNFLNATIYENTNRGPVIKQSNILISLIDTDPESGVPILNINTGKELFSTKKFTESNPYVEMHTNTLKIDDLYENLSLANITSEQGHKIILTDRDSGTNFEVYVNDDNIISIQAVDEVGKDEEILLLVTTDDDGNVETKKYSLSVSNNQLELVAYYGSTEGSLSYNINGEKAFYKMFINDDELLESEVIHFNRFDIYNTLLSNPIQLSGGSDGGNVILNNTLNMYGPGEPGKENAKQLLIKYFNEDSLIKETLYPKYDFDYIPDWTNDFNVASAIVNLADMLGTTCPITCLGYSTSAEEDIKKRQQDYFINSFNTLIYSGQSNTEHFDEGSGSYIVIPHSFMGLLINLKIDRDYSITEPPANIIKGVILESKLRLTYRASSGDIEKLRNLQINSIIEEADGTYEIDQITAFKKSSKLSRINVVKPIHRMRKDIPKLLKEFIQVKAISSNLNIISNKVSKYMDKYKVGPGNERDGIFSSIAVKVYFIEEENHLVVSITINPIGTIETISVPILVQ